MICSQAIVFLFSFSLISFASEEMSVMNSTQHSIRRSRASLANVRPVVPGGRISWTIFWTVAVETVSVDPLEERYKTRGRVSDRVQDMILTFRKREVVVACVKLSALDSRGSQTGWRAGQQRIKTICLPERQMGLKRTSTAQNTKRSYRGTTVWNSQVHAT